MTEHPMTFDDLPLVLSAKEAAQFLRIPPSTVYEQMRCGRLKSIKVGKQYRILKQELLQFLGHELSAKAAN